MGERERSKLKKEICIIPSTSGGKDSTAMLLLALEQYPKDDIYPVFADTGNENPITIEYLDYLENKLGLKIHRLKQDLNDSWKHRTEYIRNKWPEKGVPPEVVERALSIMEKGPTGIPFLDLAIIKGRFPSRMAQFCTQVLKTHVLQSYTYEFLPKYKFVESWQGVRAEESLNRAKLPERESDAGMVDIYRPILKWTVSQVFEMHRKHGVEPNPLYKMGMNRVGCMPCINVRKNELLEISKRFPEHIKRIAEWEKLVSEGSKIGQSTFFHHDEILSDPNAKPTIFDDVEWSKTSFGGVQYDWTLSEEPKACASSYGLCE